MGLPRIACHWLLSLSVLSILFVFAHSTLQPQTETLANDSAHPLPIPPWVGKQRITCTTTSAGTPLSDNCSTTAVPDVMHIDSIPPQSDNYCTNNDNTQNPDNSRLVAAKNNNSNNSNNSNMIHYTTGYLNPNRSLSSSSSKSHLDDTTTAVHTRQLADIGSVLSSWGGVMKGWVAHSARNDSVYNYVSSPAHVLNSTKKYSGQLYADVKDLFSFETSIGEKSQKVGSILTSAAMVVSTLLYPLVFFAILSDLRAGHVDTTLIASFAVMLAQSPFIMAYELRYLNDDEWISKAPPRLAMLAGATANLVYAVASILERWDVLTRRFSHKSIKAGTLIGVIVCLLAIYREARQSLAFFRKW
eukprot:GHVQ01010682.1.p1 GENE.GHVQ01010682.1~~GHVQ01010682.1.p1  ORF type:complete len:359 (+),score=58.56 GHVQ01010682.1:153-1229(+)